MLPWVADALNRYEFRVDRRAGIDACHLWTGGSNSKGYGVFSVKREGKWVTMRAHRFGFVVANGREPHDDLLVRHLVCDRPPCQNPYHLAEGTLFDNVDDRTRLVKPRRTTLELTWTDEEILSGNWGRSA